MHLSSCIVRTSALVAMSFIIGCSTNRTQNLQDLGGAAPTKITTEEHKQSEELTPREGGPLSDIHFGYNDYTVQPQDSGILRSNASWLQAHPDATVQVQGNCDERGSEDYNMALGAKRAESARDYLVTMGISPGRISTISYGKELPICQEHNEDCWQRNRRDHFVVSGGTASR